MTDRRRQLVPMVSPAACSVGDIQGYDDDYLLLDPDPLAHEFPSDAYYELNAKVMKSIGVRHGKTAPATAAAST